MGKVRTCKYCDHDVKDHKEEDGFYDVRAYRGECQIVGCPCEKFRA